MATTTFKATLESPGRFGGVDKEHDVPNKHCKVPTASPAPSLMRWFADACNVYRELDLPDEIFEIIQDYREVKAS